MNFSYLEIKSWLTNIDFTIIGSGIVGLNCALQLKKMYSKANILILEKGMLPQGASTKNAGFACFGSLSEILDDLNTHTEVEVFNLVKKRIEGLQLLRQTLGDTTINYQAFGGYELFTENDNLFENFSSTGPKVVTGGNVKIGSFSHIGIGSVVKNNILIKENVICGGKSYVNKNCKKNSIYYGIPSKFKKLRKLGEKYL